jgi:ABC-type transporter Mla subunit MlaD
MHRKEEEREKAIRALDRAVADAASFFADVDECLWDGHQNAREVLSQLLFWHREYVTIAVDIARRRQLSLRKGTFAELNTVALQEFADRPLCDLATELSAQQERLRGALRDIPDWEVNFPIKRGSRRRLLKDRIITIEAVIRGHLRKLERARRLGEEWVRAYYDEPT